MPYSVNLTFGTWAELVLACGLVMAAVRYERLGRQAWIQAWRLATVLARYPRAMILLAGIFPVVVRVLLLTVDPVPKPYVMEEFNHLFLVDTYSLGRLTNPVHPLSVLIQSYQQIQWPFYISGRPPLPPIFLFVGQALVGSPFAGNLLAVGSTSAALCWMLQGWVSNRWAAIGSFLAIVVFCLFGYWANSYWAPTPIVLGGAILMGLVPRIERRPQFRQAPLFVFALILLAGTRPYENGIYAATIGLWLAFRFLRPEGRPMLWRAVVRVALPVAVGALAIVGAQLAYNQATTGNIAVMPYQIWRASQDVTPMFLWQPMAPVPEFYYHGAARFAAWNAQVVKDITEGGLFGGLLLFGRQSVTFRDLLGPFLFLPLLCWSREWLGAPQTRERRLEVFGALCVVLVFLAVGGAGAAAIIKALVLFVLFKRWRNPNERLAILLLITGMIATSLPTFYMNVYFAAFTAPMLLLCITGLRNLSLWHGRYGRSLAGYLAIGAAVMPIGQAVVAASGVESAGPALSHFDQRLPDPRDTVIVNLAGKAGKHVVFVQATRLVSSPVDPVWNAPNVDDQKIVWLRDLRPDWTATAQQYYKGRQFWLMRVNSKGEFRLLPYPSGSLPAAAALESLPNPDRAGGESVGARKL